MAAALLFKLKFRALNLCSETAKAYADCCRGRSVSMVWACRAPLKDLNSCLQAQCASTATCSHAHARTLTDTELLQLGRCSAGRAQGEVAGGW